MATAPGVDARPENYTHDGILKVLIPVSAVGWLLFGVICILCINGQGRAGRWVPEWYLDSDGTRRDKLAVGTWWLAILLMWPVILPLVGARGLIHKARTCAEKWDRMRQMLMREKICEEGVEHQPRGEGQRSAGTGVELRRDVNPGLLGLVISAHG
ncbi:conserved leucine-rich repeat protein [Purpureocillium lavendulum]|uniref:Conserved leucine-rich repeat protein n=1 Tax=Purpureocillium lavendulum TaxID=1247861 RepID=A0AB34FLB1_9HYPO|nr:conserved leucine-rich repeat protein [Purpureocillium lavendulum]